jgi:predicted nucleic acid-binding protein
MGRRWVVNASPVILLAKVGYVSLLEALTVELTIPDAVAREIREGPESDPGRQWLEGAGGAYLYPPEPVVPVVAGWDMGAGESQVLSWAYQRPGSEVILDDRAARNCAAALGVPVRGTLGVLLLAKREGKVPLVTPILDDLRSAGFRISAAIGDTARRLAGEA